MFRVGLFTSGKVAGFVRFDEAQHRMRPEGMLSRDSIDLIRKELEAGRVNGAIGSFHWYRQATPFCPLNPAKPCPCDEEICGVV